MPNVRIVVQGQDITDHHNNINVMRRNLGMVFQSEVIRNVPKGTSVAMSIYSGIFNVGIGGGALIGGLVCSGINVGAIGYIGGIISIAACLACIMYLQPRLKK